MKKRLKDKFKDAPKNNYYFNIGDYARVNTKYFLTLNNKKVKIIGELYNHYQVEFEDGYKAYFKENNLVKCYDLKR